MAKQEAKPEVAYSLVRTPAGWVASRIVIEGGKVVSRKKSEPDMRAIALENFQRLTLEAWDSGD